LIDPEEARRIAEHQRACFNRAVEAFDVPQPPAVLERLRQVVEVAAIAPGETVLDVGAGVGVLVPFIRDYRPGRIIACDLAERMLERLTSKYPEVAAYRADIAQLELPVESVDVIFMNAMYGNIADKPAAHGNVVRMLRPGGRLLVSHPEGRAFVDHLRADSELFIEPYPTQAEFAAALAPHGLVVTQFRDEAELYVMVACKVAPSGMRRKA
jgi:SAM-dependent methyltransferase